MTATDQTISLSLFRFNRLSARAWAFSQMLFARRSMARTPDIGFWKLFGSGTGEGFTPVPNTGVYGILATWPSGKVARERISTAPIYQRYRSHAVEDWSIFLQTTSARGRWDGETPFQAMEAPNNGALAALTRATLRPSILLKFWNHVPSISQAVGSDPNIAFKIGLGEVPWFQQVTFSVWPDMDSMAAFARRDGPHAKAIKAVRDGKWFAEELYARFEITGSCGSWNGSDPLRRLGKAHTA